MSCYVENQFVVMQAIKYFTKIFGDVEIEEEYKWEKEARGFINDLSFCCVLKTYLYVKKDKMQIQDYIIKKNFLCIAHLILSLNVFLRQNLLRIFRTAQHHFWSTKSFINWTRNKRMIQKSTLVMMTKRTIKCCKKGAAVILKILSN